MDNAAAKAVLFEVADVLDAAGVPFFLQNGTALGAYRDGDFIEGDGDIDLGMLLEYYSGRGCEIHAELQRRGFKVQAISAPWKAHEIGARALKIKGAGAHLDLCGWMKHGDERFLQSSITDYALVHPARQIETLTQVHLAGRMFNIPYPPETYLKSEYGPDWRTPWPPEKCGTAKSKSRVYGYLKSRGITP